MTATVLDFDRGTRVLRSMARFQLNTARREARLRPVANPGFLMVMTTHRSPDDAA